LFVSSAFCAAGAALLSGRTPNAIEQFGQQCSGINISESVLSLNHKDHRTFAIKNQQSLLQNFVFTE
jgi:hypothetical protein